MFVIRLTGTGISESAFWLILFCQVCLSLRLLCEEFCCFNFGIVLSSPGFVHFDLHAYQERKTTSYQALSRRELCWLLGLQEITCAR